MTSSPTYFSLILSLHENHRDLLQSIETNSSRRHRNTERGQL